MERLAQKEDDRALIYTAALESRLYSCFSGGLSACSGRAFSRYGSQDKIPHHLRLLHAGGVV